MGHLPLPARISAVIVAALVLPGSAAAASTVDVYPTGGTNTANPATQISFRGTTKIKHLSVTGSRTGRHSGRMVVHPDGNGVSFFPDHHFAYGELVTVQSSTKLTRADSGGAVRFRIFTPPVAGDRKYLNGKPSGDPEGNPPEAQSFHSRKDLRPPDLGISTRLPGSSNDDIFLAVKSGPGQNGPTIRDPAGRLIWFKHIAAPDSPYDFRAQTYHGKPVLTWWQGKIYTGKGRGHGVILDHRYRTLATVNAGNGFAMDQHEFQLTPQGTVLIIAFQPVRYNLSPAGGPRDGTTWDSIVQEVDVKTGLVYFEWHSLAEVSVRLGTFPIRGRSPYDPFHANTIAELDSDHLLISARNANALFDINRHSGRVAWRLGGKRSSFDMGAGTWMIGQHDSIPHPDGTITAFDNGASTRFPDMPDRPARGVTLGVDTSAKTVSLVHEYHHPGKELFTRSQGSMQVLPSGNVFISWGGGQPYMTEFTPGGDVVFEASILPADDDTYRAYRLPWHGARPTRRPDVTASTGGSRTDVYASWNGATGVHSWEVLTGDSPSSLHSVGTASRTDFETHIVVSGSSPAYVEVRARGSNGRVLGTSSAVRPKRR